MAARFESVPVVCEVVLLLRPVGHKNLEAIGEGNFVVHVFLCDFAGSDDYLVGFFLIAWLEIAQRGHLHVRAHIHMMALHGLHGVSASIVAHPGHVVHFRRTRVGHVALGSVVVPKAEKLQPPRARRRSELICS